MAGRVSTAALCCCKHATPFAQSIPLSQSIRCFSTTGSRKKHGSIPTLTCSSSAPPELADLLANVRDTIFVPAQLRRLHKNLIYRPSNHSVLVNEPVSVTIGSEDYTLKPINRLRDEPDSWRSLLKAIDLMGTSIDDWRGGFLGLLEGFHTAGRRWKTWQWELLLRRAGQHGMANVVVEAARRGRRTGLKLAEIRIVREAFWACRVLAQGGAEDRWDETKTAQALRFAEQLSELLEHDNHCGDAVFAADEKDPRVQVDCMGVLLELAALRSQKHLGGADADGKVKKYTERLVTNLERGMVQGMDSTEELAMAEGRKAAAADYELLRWVPVANGLQIASEVLGTQMPYNDFVQTKRKELATRNQELGSLVAEAGEQAHLERRRGFKWLNELEHS